MTLTNITVVGGGTAGWLSALYAQKLFPFSNITVIASSEIGILGAGEGTTPDFIEFLKEVGIDPLDLIRYTNATIKKSIKFVNWNGDNRYYWQNFTSKFSYSAVDKLCNEWRVNYDSNLQKLDVDALHVDAIQLASFLQLTALSRGIQLIDAKVLDFQNDDGFINGILLDNGYLQPCDFVIDCSGFKRLIIGKHYKTNYKSYCHMLPMKKAMPFFIDNTNEDNLPPYTESIAMKYGWMWKIPVQGRYGCGYVWDSDYADEDEIKNEIEEMLGHKINVPRMFQFEAGCFENTWVKNCVAIGLSSGFIEPLEATSIWQQVISLKLLNKYSKGIFLRHKKSIESYNSKVNSLNSYVLNFVYFHYLTQRTDTEFWRNFKSKNKPTDTVLKLIEIEKTQGLNHQNINQLFFNSEIDDLDQNITLKNWIATWHIIGKANHIFSNDVKIEQGNYENNIDTTNFLKHLEFIHNVI